MMLDAGKSIKFYFLLSTDTTSTSNMKRSSDTRSWRKKFPRLLIFDSICVLINTNWGFAWTYFGRYEMELCEKNIMTRKTGQHSSDTFGKVILFSVLQESFKVTFDRKLHLSIIRSYITRYCPLNSLHGIQTITSTTIQVNRIPFERWWTKQLSNIEGKSQMWTNIQHSVSLVHNNVFTSLLIESSNVRWTFDLHHKPSMEHAFTMLIWSHLIKHPHGGKFSGFLCRKVRNVIAFFEKCCKSSKRVNFSRICRKIS